MESNQRANPLASGAEGSGESVLNKASAGAHAAVDSIAGAADGMARQVKPAIDKVSAMAHKAVDSAAGVAAPAADWLSEQGECLKATQEKLVAGTCSYVSNNPLKSIGMALAAGFLIGRMIRR